MAETNVCAIKDTAVSGKNEYLENEEYFIEFEEEQKPLFIPDFTGSGLDSKVELGRTGIYICQNGNANEINNCSSEIFTIGIVSLVDCNTSINTAYIEHIAYYGIVIGMGEALANINTVYFEAILAGADTSQSYPFYFGEGVSADINTVNCMRYSPVAVGDLFKIDVENVYVTFSNTKYITRKYNKHVFFLDETPDGANFGSVYIDETTGSDFNYGFNENDALRTFDEALVRVQNQSTINPVKKILLNRTSRFITKSAVPMEIENADILICSYGSGGSNAVLLYDVDPAAYTTGYLLLGSNVKLTFKEVDIDISHTSTSLAPTSSVLCDVSLFCLKDNFSQIHFEGSTINLQAYYVLVSSYASSFGVFETKMVNVSVLDATPITGAGAWLCNAGSFMAIDCVAYNSTITVNMAAKVNRGWDVGLLVRNSFL